MELTNLMDNLKSTHFPTYPPVPGQSLRPNPDWPLSVSPTLCDINIHIYIYNVETPETLTLSDTLCNLHTYLPSVKFFALTIVSILRYTKYKYLLTHRFTHARRIFTHPFRDLKSFRFHVNDVNKLTSDIRDYRNYEADFSAVFCVAKRQIETEICFIPTFDRYIWDLM